MQAMNTMTIVLRTCTWVGIGSLIVACSVNASVPPLSNNVVDASCAGMSGAVACNDALAAMCDRVIQCCTSPNAPTCASWATDSTMCQAYWVQQGYNCASDHYANSNVCASDANSCTQDVPLVSCTDFYGSTANWPASCNTMWAEYTN